MCSARSLSSFFRDPIQASPGPHAAQPNRGNNSAIKTSKVNYGGQRFPFVRGPEYDPIYGGIVAAGNAEVGLNAEDITRLASFGRTDEDLIQAAERRARPRTAALGQDLPLKNSLQIDPSNAVVDLIFACQHY